MTGGSNVTHFFVMSIKLCEVRRQLKVSLFFLFYVMYLTATSKGNSEGKQKKRSKVQNEDDVI